MIYVCHNNSFTKHVKTYSNKGKKKSKNVRFCPPTPPQNGSKVDSYCCWLTNLDIHLIKKPGEFGQHECGGVGYENILFGLDMSIYYFGLAMNIYLLAAKLPCLWLHTPWQWPPPLKASSIIIFAQSIEVYVALKCT